MLHRIKLKTILKNEYIFSLISRCMMVLIGLVESALLARYLGAELKGQLSYIYSMASTLYLFLTFGMYTAYPFKRKDNNIDIVYLLNEFMTIVCTLFSAYFVILISAGLLFYRIDYSVALIIIMLPIMGYDKVCSFVFMIENPNKANWITLITNLVQCVYLVFLTRLVPQNLIAGVCYYLLGCVIRSITFTFKLNFEFKFSLFSFSTLWGYIRFGFFPMVALLLTTLNYRLDIIMLKQMDTVSLAQIGLYSIGIGLSEKALLIPDAIKEVLLSKLAKGKGADEVAKIMRICFVASLLTAAAINLLGGLIIDLLYGYEYAGAEQVTYISVWGTTVMVFFKMISQYNVVHHKQHLNVIFLILSIGINCVLNLLLIPKYGIIGAAMATVAGHMISSAVFLFYFKKVSSINYKQMIFLQKEDIRMVADIISG